MKKSYRRRRIVVNLALCSCAGAVEYFLYTLSRRSLGEDGSRTVLVAKPDIAARCIHRVELTVFKACPIHPSGFIALRLLSLLFTAINDC